MPQPDRSRDYWQSRATSFSALYEGGGYWRRDCVSRFLNSRTERLMPLVDCPRDAKILDLGCGSGVHVKLLASRCQQIVGVDYSEKMLSVAREQLQASGLTNWRLELADAQDLPFRAETFDWIISMGLLDYVASPKRVLSECFRVLKDRGVIVFTIPKAPSIFALLRTSLGNFIKRRFFNLPPITHVVTRTELDGLLRSSGFRLCHLSAVWTTMWIVRARKIPY